MKKSVYINSPVILVFTLISIIALILSYLTNQRVLELFFSTYNSPLSDPLTYIRAILHIFGHIDLNHFASNMMIILLVGPLLEEKYKAKALIQLIIVTALLTALINRILFPNIALLGASGVCFAFIILSSITGEKEKGLPLTFILVFIVYIGTEIFNGILSADNISNLSHIIGGIIGGLFGLKTQKRTTEKKTPIQDV